MMVKDSASGQGHKRQSAAINVFSKKIEDNNGGSWTSQYYMIICNIICGFQVSMFGLL